MRKFHLKLIRRCINAYTHFGNRCEEREQNMKIQAHNYLWLYTLIQIFITIDKSSSQEIRRENAVPEHILVNE